MAGVDMAVTRAPRSERGALGRRHFQTTRNSAIFRLPFAASLNTYLRTLAAPHHTSIDPRRRMSALDAPTITPYLPFTTSQSCLLSLQMLISSFATSGSNEIFACAPGFSVAVLRKRRSTFGGSPAAFGKAR